MKRFFGKSLLLGALTATAVIALACLIPADPTSYFAATIDKHRQLSQVPSPKVILVGGSNLAFSVDSATMQKELGTPVVNMGLHANLGLRFMLNEVTSDLDPSDIVIIIPEYQHFTGSPLDGSPKELAAVTEVYPHALLFLRTPKQFANVAAGLAQLQASKLSLSRLVQPALASTIYSRSAFNANGDAVGHLALHTTLTPQQPFWASAPIYDPEAGQVINQFAAEASRRGARVLFVFPCLPSTVYAKNRETIEEIAARLQNELAIPILGSPALYTFPDEYFFDSVYHMTGAGRTVRTDRMLSDLGILHE